MSKIKFEEQKDKVCNLIMLELLKAEIKDSQKKLLQRLFKFLQQEYNYGNRFDNNDTLNHITGDSVENINIVNEMYKLTMI